LNFYKKNLNLFITIITKFQEIIILNILIFLDFIFNFYVRYNKKKITKNYMNLLMVISKNNDNKN